MLRQDISLGKQTGVGLAELMIGITIGLIVLSGTIAIYVNTIKSSSSTLLSAKLNQDLSAIMSLMVSDIRRAGYWGTATSGSINNPFTVTISPATNLSILESNSCVMYTYDRNADGASAGEFYGFKHIDSDSDGVNDSIHILNGTGSTTDDCSTGTWSNTTDTKTMIVDTLSFSSTGSKCLNSTSASPQKWSVETIPSALNACGDNSASSFSVPVTGDILVESRQVTVTVSGFLRSDPSVRKSLTETVNLRNDRIFQY